MEFFLKKNATLPVLKMSVVKDGRSDYNNFMDFIEESAIFFSMTDIETGIPKIVTRPAGFVKKELMDPNAPFEYYVYYQFQSKDTRKVGRYEGQFLLRNNDGVLIHLPYESCYVSEFPCCLKTPVIPITTTTTTTTPTPTPSPTPTPTPSPTPNDFVVLDIPEDDVNFDLVITNLEPIGIPEGDLNFDLVITNLEPIGIPEGNLNFELII